MKEEISFKKYKTRGAGYHWEMVSRSVRKRNVFVIARYELIVNLIGNEIKGKKILEIGCGDGILSFLLAQKGAYVTGIDISKEAIKFARDKCNHMANMDFLLSSAYELTFREKSFDYVVSSDVIEHLVEPEKMLLEIKRVWNKTGKVIITTPIKFTKYPLDKMHYQEFYEEEFNYLLGKYFEEIKVCKTHPLFWYELQNKLILGGALPKLFLNCCHIFCGFNPFLKTGGWRNYTLQTAI